MGIYGNLEVTPEEEARIIEETAQKIHKHQIEMIAILTLESAKPLVWIAGELGRFFVTPFMPIISEGWGITTEKYLRIFEQRPNIDILLKRVEELAAEEERRRDEERRKAAEERKTGGSKPQE